MNYQAESKFQCWRAIAVFNDGEALLHLGRSSDQVRGGYASAFVDLHDADARTAVQQIALQCWAGVADQGHWATKAVLPIPKSLSPVRVRPARERPPTQTQTGAEHREMGSRFTGAA